MKKSYLVLLALSVACLTTSSAVSGATFSINDNENDSDVYWGGQGVGNTNYSTSKDILGKTADYEVSRMDVSTTASTLDFKIYSQFFDNINEVGQSIKYDGQGNVVEEYSDFVQMGDLFLSNDGWTPDTTGTHNQWDNSQNGTGWEYALVLDSYDGSTTSGVLSLFDIINPLTNIVLVDDLHENYLNSRRWGQEVRYDGSGQDALQTGTWSIVDNVLRMTMSWDGTGYDFNDMGLVDDIGVHWTMSCGNDVIEGGDPVPEPATMLLFGAGLVGLIGRGLKKKK
jgi:hypothetical protein